MAAGVSLVGAGLAYLGARRGSRPDALAVRQSERDEWGRRFALAIELMTDPSAAQRAMGRALVDALLDSDLAQDDDRRIARALLQAAVLAGIPVSGPGPGRGSQRGGTFGARAVDAVAVVEDD